MRGPGKQMSGKVGLSLSLHTMCIVEVHWMTQSGEKSQVVVREQHLDVAQKQIFDV